MSKYHNKNHLYVKNVTLVVKHIEPMLKFYQESIGLELLKKENNVYDLGVSNKRLVRLIHHEHAEPKRRTTGLYHFAILLPSRAHLGQILKHFLTHEVRLTGASDHGVSEALYLNDPEGNGIEIYADRESASWPREVDDSVIMYTEMMDAQSVLDSAFKEPFIKMSPDTVMGHLHLHVGSLQIASKHFIDLLGFQKVLDYGDSALFISDKGYHHHIGLNTWNGTSIPNRSEHMTGLQSYELNVPSDQYDDLLQTLAPHYTIDKHLDYAVFTDYLDIKVYLSKA